MEAEVEEVVAVVVEEEVAVEEAVVVEDVRLGLEGAKVKDKR